MLSEEFKQGSSYLDMFQKDSCSGSVEAGLDVCQNSLKTGAPAGRLYNSLDKTVHQLLNKTVDVPASGGLGKLYFTE